MGCGASKSANAVSPSVDLPPEEKRYPAEPKQEPLRSQAVEHENKPTDPQKIPIPTEVNGSEIIQPPDTKIQNLSFKFISTTNPRAPKPITAQEDTIQPVISPVTADDLDPEIKAIIFSEDRPLDSRHKEPRTKEEQEREDREKEIKRKALLEKQLAEVVEREGQEFRVIEYFIPETVDVGPIPAIVGFDIDGGEMNNLVFHGTKDGDEPVNLDLSNVNENEELKTKVRSEDEPKS